MIYSSISISASWICAGTSGRAARAACSGICRLIAATRSLAKEGDDLLAQTREKGKPRRTVNFKNALALVAANLEELLLAGAGVAAEAAARAAAWILAARSRLRPGRSYPRVSKTPASKWTRRRGKKPKVPKAGAAQPA